MACFWSREWDAISKKAKYLLLPGEQFAENLILVFGFFKMQEKDKSKFVAKFVGIIISIPLLYKNSF